MLGLVVVGAIVGLAGRQFHPGGRVVSLPAALVLGVLGALAMFYGGRAARLFTDGQLTGWAAAIAGAAVLVGVWGVVRPRR
ncbi:MULTISPECIES: hypothetical protein [unclassified Cupriavidus]|uniref:hypothetical protein n=1 Tax=unclassified Cupriavidus TaxID=2640874 RepID=UPI000882B0F3|nr:hypothetical protein [Cupriavidus sp. YR651]SDD66241.1 hypothetical protein SAMN05216345_11329 [Cupriavidus sp. YR651]